MEINGITPIQQSQRTAIVDILRGWALLGVVLMNYFYFTKFGDPALAPKIDTTGNVITIVLNVLFASKSWTLLSVLFGYGFAVLINNIQKKGLNPVKFFSGRMFWLFVLALINCCFFFGDILKDYALMGLLFLFFYKSKGKFAFTLALVLIAMLPVIAPLVKRIPANIEGIYHEILPLYHGNILDVFKANLIGTYKLEVILPVCAITIHIVKLACLLLGFAAYKFDVFNNLPKHIGIVKRVFWYSLIIAVSLSALINFGLHYKWAYTAWYNPNYLLILSTMTFTVAAICWLYEAGKFKSFFSGMQYMGKMTLTNYMVQNVIGMFVFSGAGFGVYNTMRPAFYVVLAIIVFTMQVFFSRWWLKHYHYGPVEWVWRQLSYGTRLPIRKTLAVAV